jgi:tetratricopeptide (TPR) repeat protein
MKVTRIFLSAALIFMTLALCLAAEEKTQESVSPERLFGRGNDYYENAEYGKAIDEYEKILDERYESGPLYYNIAGAYFKAGSLGKAILNYERAKLLMPRDADLTANHRFAQAKVKGGAIPEKGIWAWSPLRIYSENFTVDELTWLSSGAYALIIVLLFVIILRPNRRWYGLVSAVLFFVFILFNFTIIWHKVDKIGTTAVTIAPEAEALFGPFDSATKFFTLPEGADVTVLKVKDDWYKVRRADGKVGWIRKSDVERI